MGTFSLLQAVRSSTGSGITTFPPTRCTETSNWAIRTEFTESTRTTRRAPTRRRRHRATVRARLDAFVRVRATLSNCSEQLRPVSTCGEVHPAADHQSYRRSTSQVVRRRSNVRDWIHVEDHNSAVWAIIDRGKSVETYLIGADGEMDNRTVMESILQILGLAPTISTLSPTARGTT